MKRKFLPELGRPSTRAFTREAKRIPDYTRFDWLHGYVYIRWPYFYIGIGTGEHPLSKVLGPIVRSLTRLLLSEESSGNDGLTFADTYHGKVVPLEAAKQLVTVNEEVCLTNLEQVIPYARARDIVLKNPDHIVVLKCPCRASRPNPCHPLDVCLIIGEPFAGFVAEHHPGKSRWISQEEAMGILEAEHDRGHVHHAFFKDAMLGRFYAICNCCSCCCGAMQAWQNGVPMLASSGFVSQVNPDQCAGCGQCGDSCQFGAISLSNGTASVNEADCMGCGVCVSGCKEEALSLVRVPSRGEPLEIRKLMAEASVP